MAQWFETGMTAGPERHLRILQRLAAVGGATSTDHLCTLAAEVVGVSGAGVMLMSGDVAAGQACSSDAIATAIEELQFSLGEGPSVDAYGLGRPVLEPDLATPGSERWPAFAPAALEAGARAVFGFPLQVGGARLGALNLYRAASGELSAEQHADALVTANVVARTLLAMQADAPPGVLAAEIAAGDDQQLVVHQASGMVAAQLEVKVTEALIRLRAYAFANDVPLSAVARDIVARRLRFDAETGDAG